MSLYIKMQHPHVQLFSAVKKHVKLFAGKKKITYIYLVIQYFDFLKPDSWDYVLNSLGAVLTTVTTLWGTESCEKAKSPWPTFLSFSWEIWVVNKPLHKWRHAWYRQHAQ